MNRRRFGTIALLTLGFVLGGILHPFHWAPTFAQGDCRAFPETGKQVCGRFLQYWTTNGGLAQQGLPLTNEFTEISDLNGQAYTVQYFERAVFENHPENAAPYDVLLSQLGTFRLHAKYPGGDPSGTTPPPLQPTAVPPSGEQPVTFEGNTDINTPAFNLQGGTYEITWSVDLQGESQTLFDVYLKSTSGSYSELLVNIIVKQSDPHTGSNLIYNVPPGQYYFDAGTSRGTWKLTLTRK